MSTIEAGELLYRLTLNITGMKEYGVSFTALMAGEPDEVHQTLVFPPEQLRLIFPLDLAPGQRLAFISRSTSE